MRGIVFRHFLMTVLALIGASAETASFAADAPSRALPTIAAACDVADWRPAQLGRDRLPAQSGAGSADALLVVSGGGFVAPAFDPQQHAARIVALADAAGIDVVNLAARDFAAAGDATKLAGGIGAAKAKFISASFKPPTATTWKSHAIVERGGRKIAVVGIAGRGEDKVDGVEFIEPRD